MKRTVVLNVVGLCAQVIETKMPRLSSALASRSKAAIHPAFPAVTCSAQADYLTGTTSGKHGIVGNGWYDRALGEVHFWKQSNRLVESPKIWEKIRESRPSFTCANLFWWFNRFSSVDIAVTPRPIYRADGSKIFNITSEPLSVADEIQKDLGPFPFHSFWGPRSDQKSSEWIGEAALWTEKRFHPDLQFVYLPHLDYNLQRWGPESPEVIGDYRFVENLLLRLIREFEKESVQVMILSEYALEEVHQPIALNRLFRKKNWLGIKEECGGEILEGGLSRVFAVVDHQIAHIYVNDRSLLTSVRTLLESTPGIDSVWGEAELRDRGLHHSRSGDFLCIAKKGFWLSYYYWENDSAAPDFARTVDIHRKPGYDPAELFIDPQISFSSLKIASFLLKKRLGIRGLLEVVPLHGDLVKGSHGRVPEDQNQYPLLIRPEGIQGKETLHSNDVFEELNALFDH